MDIPYLYNDKCLKSTIHETNFIMHQSKGMSAIIDDNVWIFINRYEFSSTNKQNKSTKRSKEELK